MLNSITTDKKCMDEIEETKSFRVGKSLTVVVHSFQQRRPNMGVRFVGLEQQHERQVEIVLLECTLALFVQRHGDD